MIVYLSGPMSGIKDYNRDAFLEAEKEVTAALKKVGDPYIKVINPWKLSAVTEKKCREVLGREPEYTDYVKADLKEMLSAHVLFMLPGWRKSRGAILELVTAISVEIPRIFTMEELHVYAKKMLSEKSEIIC